MRAKIQRYYTEEEAERLLVPLGLGKGVLFIAMVQGSMPVVHIRGHLLLPRREVERMAVRMKLERSHTLKAKTQR